MRTTGLLVAEYRTASRRWWLTIPTSHTIAETFHNVDLPDDTHAANAAHLAACWNAIENIGGDPATVGELVEKASAVMAFGEAFCADVERENAAWNELKTLLAKLPEATP